MPSASVSVPMQDKNVKPQLIDSTEPFKQVVTLIEHKIRNMEKRKVKLDAYKLEKEQGKDLNADQSLAVSKFGELMQTLEFARDLSKQITQIQQETNRVIKKQNKRDQAERVLAEAERSKEIVILTNWLHRYTTVPSVREDFCNGKNGAITLSDEEVDALNKLATITTAGMDKSKVGDLGVATEHFTNLIEGKPKSIPNTSTTYSHMKGILMSMNACDYAPGQEGNAEQKAETAEIGVPVEEKVEHNVNASECAQKTIQTQYNYRKDSHIDIESPELDPAVIAISTNAPPSLVNQQLATMQQVIPQTSAMGSQQDTDHTHGMGGVEVEADQARNEPELAQQAHMQIPPQGQGAGINQQEWDNGNYGAYGANQGEIEGNDFMENNFSTWETPHGGSGDHRSGAHRRGNRSGRYQNSNSNGYQPQNRGGGNRYGQPGSGMNRWSTPQGGDTRQQQQYDDYRGRYGGERGEMATQWMGGGPRGPPRGMNENRAYFNSGGPRNGVPRGGAPMNSGRRPYRGGGGHGGEQQGAY